MRVGGREFEVERGGGGAWLFRGMWNMGVGIMGKEGMGMGMGMGKIWFGCAVYGPAVDGFGFGFGGRAKL